MQHLALRGPNTCSGVLSTSAMFPFSYFQDVWAWVREEDGILTNPHVYLSLGTSLVVVLLFNWWMMRKVVPGPFLKSNVYQPVKLIQKERLTHNTFMFKFALARPDQQMGLPIGQHVSFFGTDADGKPCYRPYTPVSSHDRVGDVEFVIKLYPEGKMSSILSKMQVGDFMQVKGPKGKFVYKHNMKQTLGLIAGGSGITPMFQVMQAILRNRADKTQLRLIFGNVSEEDIILRPELDTLAMARKEQFSVYYVLNNPPAKWEGGSGFVTKDIIKSQFPAPGPDVLILLCGPPPMVDAVNKCLDELGYTPDMRFCF